MNPARRGTESVYESHTYVSTCTTPEFASSQVQFSQGLGEARSKASGQTGSQAGGQGGIEVRARSAGVDAAVPQRLGGDRGPHTERARHAFCMPVLPAFAPR